MARDGETGNGDRGKDEGVGSLNEVRRERWKEKSNGICRYDSREIWV